MLSASRSSVCGREACGAEAKVSSSMGLEDIVAVVWCRMGMLCDCVGRGLI